jgi:ribose transport system permease protein
MIAIFGVIQPASFLTGFNFSTLGIAAAVLLVEAVGQTFVLISGGLDLSVGSVLVFSSVVSAQAMLALSGAPVNSYGTISLSLPLVLVGLVIAACTGLGWGLLNGLLCVRTRVPPLIVTLGTLGMAEGFAEIITNGTDVRGVPRSLVAFGSGATAGCPNLVWVAAAIALVAGLVLSTTSFGRWTYLIGSNKEAAMRAGIPVHRHVASVYMISGMLAGAAGFLSLAQFGTTTLAGHDTDNLSTLAAAVIGGTSLFGGVGGIFGTVVGTLIPTVLQNGFVIIGIQPFWQEVAVGAILITAVGVDLERRAKATGA